MTEPFIPGPDLVGMRAALDPRHPSGPELLRRWRNARARVQQLDSQRAAAAATLGRIEMEMGSRDLCILCGGEGGCMAGCPCSDYASKGGA